MTPDFDPDARLQQLAKEYAQAKAMLQGMEQQRGDVLRNVTRLEGAIMMLHEMGADCAELPNPLKRKPESNHAETPLILEPEAG